MQGGPRLATATILFTDLVGSTELRSAVGERRADELRREHDQILRSVIERHGGLVVKSLGDGLMATFTSAANCLAAATDTQRALARRNLGAAVVHQLHVRIGVSVGDVVFEPDDVHGTPVIEAARLCAAADGGQVLTSATVRLVAGGRSSSAFADLGTRSYKGLPDPLGTLELRWRDDERRWPLPPDLAPTSALVVGREAEIADLEQLWAAAADGRPRLAVVRGEPGIGKTTLLADLAGALSDAGTLVLSGQCDPHLDVPYQPFAEALRSYVAMVGPRADRLGELPGELRHLVPELADLVPDLPEAMAAEPDTQRYRLAVAVGSWLVDAAARSPLLLVVEDLHWGARGMAALLHQLAGLRGAGTLMVVATARDAEPGDELSSVVEEVADLRISLRGLARPALERWLEHLADQPVEASDLAAGLQRDTGGNPLYVREVLRHLTETGWLHQVDGRWTSSAPTPETGELPGTLREVLRQRLERLPGEAKGVLGAAAVLGRTFDLPRLKDLVGLGAMALADALDVLERAGLVSPTESGSWTFAHALVRAASLDDLGPTRRAALHNDVAEALGRSGAAAPAELAHHWCEAAPLAGPGKAVAALRAGAEAAADQLAFDEAVGHIERALTFAIDEQERCRLLVRLGEVQHRAGDERFRATLAAATDAAVALGDRESLARAAIATARPGIWYSSVGVSDAALVQRYETAIEAVGPEPSEERARLLVLLAQELYWTDQAERRLRCAREALEMATAVGEACRDAIIPTYVMAIWDPGTRDERRALVDELEHRSSGTGTLEMRFHTRYLRTIVLMEAGDLEAAAGELQFGLELAEELRYPILLWRCVTRKAALALLRDTAEGEAVAQEAMEIGLASGQPDALSSFGAQYFVVCWDRGQLADLGDAVTSFVEAMPGIPAWRAVHALLLVETGQDEAAAAEVAAATGPDCQLPRDSAWMVGTTLLGECAAHLGDADRARKLYDLLLPHRGDLVDVVQGLACLGSVDRTLGLLAACLERWEEADAHFAAALELEERAGAAAFSVRTRRDHASALARWGPAHHERARALAGDAERDASRLGMAADVERLRALVRRLDTAGSLLADEA